MSETVDEKVERKLSRLQREVSALKRRVEELFTYLSPDKEALPDLGLEGEKVVKHHDESWV